MADEGQCIFCMIANGKVQTLKVYEDELCVAFLDIKPASKGHVQVISKAHAPLLSKLDEPSRQRVYSIALTIGNTLVSSLKATGVSYIINEGAGAGQRVAHASIHVIPRYENDGLNISWEGKEMGQEELGKYYNDVAAAFGSAPEAKPAPKQKEPEPVKEKPKESEKVIRPRIPRYW
jgi:histidine triad (HIT) family protein